MGSPLSSRGPSLKLHLSRAGFAGFSPRAIDQTRFDSGIVSAARHKTMRTVTEQRGEEKIHLLLLCCYTLPISTLLFLLSA